MIMFNVGCADTQRQDSAIYAEMDFYAEEENEEISHLLDRVRDAIGITSTSIIDFSIEGETEFMGNPGRYVFAINSEEDAWFTAIQGPIEYAFGYDATDYYVKFMDGITRKAGPNETSRSRLSGYVLSHAWLLENAPFRWNLESDENSDHLLYYQLLDSYSRGVISIDAETYLPVKWVSHSWEGEEVFRFEGRFDDQSPWLPSYIEITDSDGVTSQTRITERKANNQPVRDQLRTRLKQNKDFFFDVGRDAVVDLRRSWRGHLMVQASVNNSDPAWFFLDTGAGVSVLDNRFVEKLGIETIGKMDLLGVGGPESATFHRADQFSVGPLTIRDYLVSALDLSFLDQIFDEPIAGIIGSGIFSRSIVEIDVEGGQAAFYEVPEYEDEGVTWLPMIVDDGTPAVEGKLEGHNGLFVLDTGDGTGALGIHSQAVADHNLLENRRTREVGAGGVGGQVRVQRGRIDTLEIGPYVHHDFEANFFEETGGGLSNPYYLGTIGMRILRDYRIILDYENARMALISTP